MGLCVCAGAVLQCSFGSAPSTLNVLPTGQVMSMTPVACAKDCAPFVNLLPFGMCQNPANPMVAAATAAALGVLTPMPCIPACPAPWTGTSTDVTVGGSPALTNSSTLTCTWGGQIQIKFPGQANITVD